MPNWSAKSQAGFDTLHTDLQTLCGAVIIVHDCSILWGHRERAIQNALYAEGKSKLRYPDSKHNGLPSEAVDLIPYRYGFNPYGDAKYVTYFCGLVLGIGAQLYAEGKMSRKIRWGGSWSTDRNKKFASFFDAYHFEI